MLRLCALAAVAAWSCAAWAIEPEVSSTFATQSSSGDSRRGGLSRVDGGLRYGLGGLGWGLGLNGALKLGQADYTGYQVRDRRGDVHALAGSAVSELSASQALRWERGAHRLSIEWSGVFGGPMESQALGARYELALLNGATRLGARAAYASMAQPQDYFVDAFLRTTERPKRVRASEVAVSVEQALTPRWKALLELATRARPEDRPRAWGVTLGQAVAIASRVSLRASASRWQEMRTEALLNERGYFALTSGEVGVTVEPVYDWLISATYGLMVERESLPAGPLGQLAAETQVATDQYGLGVRYLLYQYEFKLQGSLSRANTDYAATAVSGELTWKI